MASIALVTGATGGIGLQIARQFAGLGWKVLVGARDVAAGAEVAAELGGRPVALDVTDADTIIAAAAGVPELDVLVNNAGISLDTGTPVTQTDVDVFRRTYETKDRSPGARAPTRNSTTRRPAPEPALPTAHRRRRSTP